MSNATRTVKEVMAIGLDEIYTSDFQKANTETARLRQIVETHSFYPSMKPTNSKSDNIFADDEFVGTEEQEFISTENRVAFINVPKGTTPEEVTKRLAALGMKAVIYRELASKPILTAEQRAAISNGLTTLDIIANSQVVRYSNDTEINGEDVSGQIIKDQNGKVQYRASYFSANAKEDADFRTPDAEDTYLTDEIKEELENQFFTSSDATMATATTEVPSGQEI